MRANLRVANEPSKRGYKTDERSKIRHHRYQVFVTRKDNQKADYAEFREVRSRVATYSEALQRLSSQNLDLNRMIIASRAGMQELGQQQPIRMNGGD